MYLTFELGLKYILQVEIRIVLGIKSIIISTIIRNDKIKLQ